jgi:hypothetical protein
MLGMRSHATGLKTSESEGTNTVLMNLDMEISN